MRAGGGAGGGGRGVRGGWTEPGTVKKRESLGVCVWGGEGVCCGILRRTGACRLYSILLRSLFKFRGFYFRKYLSLITILLSRVCRSDIFEASVM